MKRTIRHRFIAFALCCLIYLPLFLAAAHADDETRDMSLAQSLAGNLKQLGIFQGISDTDFALERAQTRAEALAMFVRMLGKEDEALGRNYTHPFTDVPSWVNPYVGHAYENGLTNGISATKFGANETTGANTYLTFMLRALGYSDGDGEDFTWSNPYALATNCGILPAEADIGDFLRADAVLVSYAALSATFKGSDEPLANKLISSGAFTPEQYAAAINGGAFSDSKSINDAVSAAIIVNEGEDGLTPYYYQTESHIILDTERDGDAVRCAVLALYSLYHYSKTVTGTFSGGSSVTTLAKVTLRSLDDGSYETVDYKSYSSFNNNFDTEIENVFSAEVLNEYQTLATDTGPMSFICAARANKYGADVFDAWQPTYEEALAEIKNREGYYMIQEYQATGCTVVYGVLQAGMHAPSYCLDLVWSDGTAKSLPLPRRNAWDAKAELDHIYLSDDGGTLYYDVTFTERSIIDEGLASEMLIHEKGTYSYAVDLPTGDVSLTITDE